MEQLVTAKGNAKEQKSSIRIIKWLFTLMVWAVMATSVRKGG